MNLVTDALSRIGQNMNTHELMVLLAKRYQTNATAFLENVRNGTGYGAKDGVRTADAISMGLWPSRGLYLTGYELKVSRSDWLSEYKNPAKADAIAKYCDFWYLVVADLSIVQTGELPENWGLLAPEKGELKVVKEAKTLEAEPLTKLFLASILRNVTEHWFPKSVLDVKMENRLIEAKSEWESTKSYREREAGKMWERVFEFEKITGVRIQDDWQPIGNIAEAVKTVMDGGYKKHMRDLEYYKDWIHRLAKEADEAYKDLEELDKNGSTENK